MPNHIALVTDSTADIPPAQVEAAAIQVVPNIIITGNESFEDGKNMSRQEFYERLPFMTPPPTTATASIGTYHQLYTQLFEQGADAIISIHAASQVSSIYNVACTAAQSFNQRVQVIDSGYISLGLGFQVLAAAEAIAQNTPLEQILKILADIRQRVRVGAMLDTLEYVRRSGRVSWVRARIGDLLRIKPILEMRQGKVFNLGEARTRAKGIQRLAEIIQSFGPLERLAILHTNAEADAQKFLKGLCIDLPFPPMIVHVTTIIGTHVGPNGLGFAALPK